MKAEEPIIYTSHDNQILKGILFYNIGLVYLFN